MTNTIDRTLSALASDATRAAIYAALRTEGVSSSEARAAGARFDEIQQLRRRREALKPARELSLAERADDWIRDQIPWPYRVCEGAGADGNTFDLARGEPSARSRSTKGWGKGLPSSYRYPVSSSHVEVTVSRTWIADVYRRGLAEVDGLTTLAANLEPDRTDYPGCEFYKAVWVEQGRGVEVNVESGYIVRQGTWTHHAPTLNGAKRAVRERAARERDTALRYTARSLDGAWAEVCRLGLEGERVTLATSTRAGNCEAGTRDWVARNLPGRTEASLREVYEAARASGDRPAFVAKVLALVAVRAARRAA